MGKDIFKIQRTRTRTYWTKHKKWKKASRQWKTTKECNTTRWSRNKIFIELSKCVGNFVVFPAVLCKNHTLKSHNLRSLRSLIRKTPKTNIRKTPKTNDSLKYIKVHTATRWTIRHGLMLLWFTDLMNVTEELQFIDPDYYSLFYFRLYFKVQ